MSKNKYEKIVRMINGLRRFLTNNPNITTERIGDALDVFIGARKAVELNDHQKMNKPYTRREVAKMIGHSEKTVDYYLRTGILKRVKRAAYSAESVTALVEGRRDVMSSEEQATTKIHSHGLNLCERRLGGAITPSFGPSRQTTPDSYIKSQSQVN